ncbi:MAG TPA: hypothetical protein VGL71_13140 [Urbifossiella sp.]
MSTTYPAMLHNDRIEWTVEAPALPPDGQPVRVNITVLETVLEAHQGRRMAAALEKIAANASSGCSVEILANRLRKLPDARGKPGSLRSRFAKAPSPTSGIQRSEVGSDIMRCA